MDKKEPKARKNNTMKFFRGTFPEIKGISADNFQGENLNSSVFFLSHIHWDHRPGLSSPEFKVKLKQPDIFVYSSKITAEVLRNEMPEYKDKFIYLDINRERMIEIPGEDSLLVVKPIPAEHCPGSVMFLFRYKKKTILYTGDFRYELNDLEKYRRYFANETIDKVYLDVTFFRREFPGFAPRDLVVEKISGCILEWLESGEENTVLILIPAYYGSEFLYKAIYERLKIPINVPSEIYPTLKCIPELKTSITNGNSKILARKKNSVSPSKQPKSVKIILPTAMFWINWDGKTISQECNRTTRFCYSCHASYEEVWAFLKLLKPKGIEANVLPKEEDDQVVLEELIQECLEEISRGEQEEVDIVINADVVYDGLKRRKII